MDEKLARGMGRKLIHSIPECVDMNFNHKAVCALRKQLPSFINPSKFSSLIKKDSGWFYLLKLVTPRIAFGFDLNRLPISHSDEEPKLMLCAKFLVAKTNQIDVKCLDQSGFLIGLHAFQRIYQRSDREFDRDIFFSEIHRLILWQTCWSLVYSDTIFPKHIVIPFLDGCLVGYLDQHEGDYAGICLLVNSSKYEGYKRNIYSSDKRVYFSKSVEIRTFIGPNELTKKQRNLIAGLSKIRNKNLDEFMNLVLETHKILVGDIDLQKFSNLRSELIQLLENNSEAFKNVSAHVPNLGSIGSDTTILSHIDKLNKYRVKKGRTSIELE